MTISKFVVLTSLLSLIALPGFAHSAFDPKLPTGEDNADARAFLDQTIFAPTDEVLGTEPRILSVSEDAHQVRFEVAKDENSYYLLFLNDNPKTAAGENQFPIAGRGNYIVKRRLSDGAFLQVKVFLQNDPDYYLRIFPDGGEVLDAGALRAGRSFVDVYLAGTRVYRDVVLPISFGQVLTDSLQRVIDLTSDSIDWGLLLPDSKSAAFSDVRSMIAAIRKALPTLPDAEDGAMDQNGRLVRISSLALQENLPGFNCSGFAKWIADGLYKPATGHFLSIRALSMKHPELRGNRWSRQVEDARDPYFGLDWTRNIAVSLMAVDRPGEALLPTAADVRDVPFQQYVQNVGYPIVQLKEVLYLLAASDPGNFYLGSVNRDFGTDPVLRQHTHVVVLFPYLLDDGEFRVAVFERNVETSTESLLKRYPNDYIHLVRVRASSAYVPPVIETASR